MNVMKKIRNLLSKGREVWSYLNIPLLMGRMGQEMPKKTLTPTSHARRPQGVPPSGRRRRRRAPGRAGSLPAPGGPARRHVRHLPRDPR